MLQTILNLHSPHIQPAGPVYFQHNDGATAQLYYLPIPTRVNENVLTSPEITVNFSLSILSPIHNLCLDTEVLTALKIGYSPLTHAHLIPRLHPTDCPRCGEENLMLDHLYS